MTTETTKCSTRDCKGQANAPGGAKGKCPRCYQRDRRIAAGVAVRNEPIAPPGEGDEVTFRLPRDEKAEICGVSVAFEFDSPSSFLRALVRGFMALPASEQRKVLGIPKR